MFIVFKLLTGTEWLCVILTKYILQVLDIYIEDTGRGGNKSRSEQNLILIVLPEKYKKLF